MKSGEVHAICGENGSEKSTLMKVICGVYKPNQGRMIVNGTERRVLKPIGSISKRGFHYISGNK